MLLENPQRRRDVQGPSPHDDAAQRDAHEDLEDALTAAEDRIGKLKAEKAVFEARLARLRVWICTSADPMYLASTAAEWRMNQERFTSRPLATTATSPSRWMCRTPLRSVGKWLFPTFAMLATRDMLFT